jgi:hypothetical protein
MAHTIYGHFKEKGGAFMTLPLVSENLISVYFPNFLMKLARPTRPEPSRSMVAGSGTGL